MLKGKKIAVIGGGTMGSIIAEGLVAGKSVAMRDIVISEIDSARLEYIRSVMRLQASSDNIKTVKSADIIVIAVKPQNMAETLQRISLVIDKTKLIISIAAGINTEFIESRFKKGCRVIRVMPNTAALIREGAAAIARGSYATDTDVKIAQAIFDHVGITVVVEEKLMDAVTGLSGSGPAYCFVMMEALADAGVQMGLTRSVAARLAAQTMLGAAKLCLKGDKHPAQLKDMVMSPAGTTAAGLKALEDGKIRATLMAAVEAATKRSKELASGK